MHEQEHENGAFRYISVSVRKRKLVMVLQRTLKTIIFQFLKFICKFPPAPRSLGRSVTRMELIDRCSVVFRASEVKHVYD